VGIALWFAALIGLVIAAAVASGRGRPSPGDVASRRVIVVAAIAYAALVAGAVWLWGGAMARDARTDRLREGATVDVEIVALRVPLGHGARSIVVGHAATATLRIPGDGLDVVATVVIEDDGTARIEAADRASGDPASRVRVSITDDRDDRACDAVPGPAARELSASGSVLATECDGSRLVAAFAVRRQPAALVVTPRVAGRGRLVREHRTVHAGDALRIGSTLDAVPNLTTWEVTAPRDSSAMLAIPPDPSDCAAWSGEAEDVDGTCVVHTGAFELAGRPFVPDPDAVIARGARAAIAIGSPALLLLLVLAVSSRRGRRARVIARALRLCVLGGGLVALACWRLVWAHRIDAMHGVAARVDDNQLAALAIGAALAGNAVLALDALDGTSVVRRIAWAIAGWSIWLAGGLVAGLATDRMPRVDVMTIGVAGLSALAAVTPVVGELAGRVARRISAVELGLWGIAATAWIAHLVGARGALTKLGLAYATVLLGHAAVRAAIGATGSIARRASLAFAVVAAVGALAILDTGVTLAIAGVGLALAMLVAGHDALYDASQAGRLGMLEREHARLLIAHGIAAAAIAIAVAVCAMIASDRALLEGGTLGVLHAPLVAGGLFGVAAMLARSHRRSWVPWLAAALAALALWGVRDDILERATAGDGVAARRVAAVVEPGYAVLRDDHAYVASASAWREVVPRGAPASSPAAIDAWHGQGFFGAQIRDPGVARSIDNDYFPVLVVRETGIAGLLQSVLLLLALVVGAGAIAAIRLRHASREQRTRWLVTGVAGTLVVYQPLASLGVLPLTGITWPGLGIDSPGDLWLFVIGAIWCLAGGADAADGSGPDARVRATPRVARARRVVIGALVICGIAAVVVVVRGGLCALRRAADPDDRVTSAVRYASSLACVAPAADAATLDDVISPVIAGRPSDGATARFERELQGRWRVDRAQLLRGLETAPVERVVAHEHAHAGRDRAPAPPPDAAIRCPARAGRWQLRRDGDACVATLSLGWPDVEIAVRPGARGVHGTCRVMLPDEAMSMLRPSDRTARERIRVVSAPIGIAADDVGELVLGARVIRLRAGAAAVALAEVPPGITVASEVRLDGAALVVRPSPRGGVLRGTSELYEADRDRGAAWRPAAHGDEGVLDRMSLVVAGPPDRRVVALFRPPRGWPGGAPAIDSLLADTAGDRRHRIYPHGSAIPDLGWVNPYDVDRSLGLDGWIHAYRSRPGTRAPSCGLLAPPPVDADRVCSPSPLDGVLECRVTIQPQLVLALRVLADRIAHDPEPLTGRAVTPVRVAFVALRGDTGEVLAQVNVATGRPPLAFPPVDARAEAALIRLRDEPGEAQTERVEWNLPIAVGSTFKPIVARAAELAAPSQLASLTLTAAGHVAGCRARHGKTVDPIAGHCPPTSVAGSPTTADLHDFLSHSPNWFQAALGLVGLGLPAPGIRLAVRDVAVRFEDVVQTDLQTWPTDSALAISDPGGPILTERTVSLAGLRRTPLWRRVENLLGRPLCTLGDRARCERAASRADVCAARGLPIDSPGADLRNLIALGPDRLDLHAGDRPRSTVPVREYLQLLRGSGVHPVGSLAQITDAFGRVVYDPGATAKLAASWFPAPAVGLIPSWSCASPPDRTATVLGGGGGLCGVVQPGGTAHRGLADLMSDPAIVIYGAKTGTIDSLADIARSRTACAAWNARHPEPARLVCGRTPPDDSLLVIAFGVVTPRGVVPVTLGIQLQRGGTGSATHAAPAVVREIARFVRGG